MAKYVINGKEVTEEYFYKQVFNMDEKTIKNTPFFLDELIGSITVSPKTDEEILKTLLNPHLRGSELREEWKTTNVDMSKANSKNVFEGVTWISDKISAEESKKIEEIRTVCLNNKIYPCLEDVTEIFKCVSEEELESILKRDMSIGAPDWSQNDTGGTVFEKVQDSNLTREVLENFNKAQIKFVEGNLPECPNFLQFWQEKHKNLVERDKEIFKSVYPNIEQSKIGKKETENKIDYGELDFDYIDAMALRMSKNLDKYPPKNWQKKMDIKELAKSAIRHGRKILQEIENDEESLADHAVALGANGMMINYQLKIDKNE